MARGAAEGDELCVYELATTPGAPRPPGLSRPSPAAASS